MSNWGGSYLGYWCGIGQRSCVGDWGCDVSYWSSCYGLDGNGAGFFAYNGVESVYGVSGIVNGAPGAISFEKRVATLNDIAVTSLVLALIIAGQTVVHVVSVAVLGMRIVIGIDGFSYYSLGYWSHRSYWSHRGYWSRGISHRGGCWDQTGISGGHESGEDYEL